jgi:hypothetical protein
MIFERLIFGYVKTHQMMQGRMFLYNDTVFFIICYRTYIKSNVIRYTTLSVPGRFPNEEPGKLAKRKEERISVCPHVKHNIDVPCLIYLE